MSSELRTKLIAEMNLHGLAANTQRGYVMSVKGLAGYYKESPETLTDEQIRAYFQHLVEVFHFFFYSSMMPEKYDDLHYAENL